LKSKQTKNFFFSLLLYSQKKGESKYINMNTNISNRHGSASAEDSSKSFKRLPLIPLSPLTQTSIEYAKVLAHTTKSLSETATEEALNITSNNVISILNKDLSKEREKLDRLTKDIQNIQSQFLADLNNYEIAKEIAYIDCSLFRLVVLDKNWISSFDKQSNMVSLLDFHRYLSHSFAHQIIYSVAVENEGGSKKTKRKSFSGSSNSSSTNTIVQLIQIAYILLHIYRDFSGCSAILTSLQMSEVQRLEKLWAQCPSKLVSIYKELVAILSPHNNYEAYHQYLWLQTARFLSATPIKSQMIAVPFLHAHLSVIRNIIHIHSVVATPVSIGNNNDSPVVLSDAGKKSFISAIHVLEFCQQHSKIDPADLEVTTAAATNRRLSTSSSKRNSISTSRKNSMNGIVGGMKLSVAPCLEIDKLHSNPNTYHWIVSRAYLTRFQLHQESLQVEPLAIGEIDLEAEEEYDLYWDFFRQPIEIFKPAKQQQQEIKKQQKVAKKHQPVVEEHQTIVDDLVIINIPLDQSGKQQGPEEENLLDSSIVAQSSDILSSTITTNTEINGTDLPKQDNTEITAIDDDVRDDKKVVEEESSLVHIEHAMQEEEEYYDDQTDIIIVAEEEEINQVFGVLDKDMVENPTSIKINQEYFYNEGRVPAEKEEAKIAPASTTVEIKPILSPTAPEFFPQKQASADDDIVILTRKNSNNDYTKLGEEEEEDEEWTGYPLDNSVSQTVHGDEEEEEEWTGYPITSHDEEEEEEADEEEVWKGYPAPQQQNSSRTIELSSPTTPQEEQQATANINKNRFSSSEEWKGYRKTSEEQEAMIKSQQQQQSTAAIVEAMNKDYPTTWDSNGKNQLHAIGKAAARRMQYSVSNMDNRKRLPSSFTPSAST
jgi:hypothetical protein